MEIKINHLERSNPQRHFEMEIPKEFANDLRTTRHSVNQLMKAPNEIGAKVGLRFSRVVDRLGRIKSHMATVPGNIQTASLKRNSQKVKTIKASCLSRKGAEDETESVEDQDTLEKVCESDSLS